MTITYRGHEIRVEVLDDQFGDEKVCRIRDMGTGQIISRAYHPIGRAREIIEDQARGWVDAHLEKV